MPLNIRKSNELFRGLKMHNTINNNVTKVSKGFACNAKITYFNKKISL